MRLLEPTSRTSYYADLAQGSRDPAMLAKLEALAATVPASARGEVTKAEGAVRYRVAVIAKRVPEMDRCLAAGAERPATAPRSTARKAPPPAQPAPRPAWGTPSSH